jgi:hypothetical protein
MKATTKLLVAALAAGGLALSGGAMAQHSHGGRVISGGGHFSGGHFSGGHRFYGPRFGFFFGAPLLIGGLGWPYYYDYYYPYGYPPGVVYRDVPAPVYEEPGQVIPPTTQAVPGPGAPAQGPLYMNYCESAKAYYPKVTSCPEGWKFITPTR